MADIRFTREEIEMRNYREDMAIIIDNLVYDVTEFLEDHPGGTEVLLDNAGKDASQCFHDVGHSDIAIEWMQKFVIGRVVDEDEWEVKKRDLSAEDVPEETLNGFLNVWGPPLMLAILTALLYNYLF